MNLTKRDCPIIIKLTPVGCYYLLIEFEINGEKHRFCPSAAVSYQFLDFMAAVYQLYSENDGWDCHNDAFLPNRNYGKLRRKIYYPSDDQQRKDDETAVEITLHWDEEGPVSTITLYRKTANNHLYPLPNEPDPITITIEYERSREKSGKYSYTVEAKDLCYAIAKAGTDAIKRFGFHGYFYSSGEDCGIEDWIDINQLLFFKAYALGAMEAREFHEVDVGDNSKVFATDFAKELELLLFEM